MTKDIVFVVHGIGEYDKNWLNDQSTAAHKLREVSKNYGFFETRSLDAYVEFVPIIYDDVFQRILNHWSDLGESLSQAIPAMPDAASKVVDYLKKSDGDQWAIQFGGDVILYWGFRLFQQRVVLRVLAQMTKKIAETITAGGDCPQYHVLAHSLGTAVAHDALHHLGTEDWLGSLGQAAFDGDAGTTAKTERDLYLNNVAWLKDKLGVANPFHPKIFGFESLTMLSNVSGLIHPSESPYHSIVRPGSRKDGCAIVRNYINVNHKYDPVSLAGNFKMPAAWQMHNGYDLQVDHVLDANIHSAAHYVAHPNVHLRLLQLYADAYQVSDKDLKAVNKFQREHGFAKLGDDLKQKVSDLIGGGGVGIDNLTGGLSKLANLLKTGGGQ